MIKVMTVDWGQSRLEGGGNVTALVQLTLDRHGQSALSRAVCHVAGSYILDRDLGTGRDWLNDNQRGDLYSSLLPSIALLSSLA
jgi:hypothetical protein